jgi:signal peptidase I
MEATLMVGQNFIVKPTDKFERNDIVVYDYYGDDYDSPPAATGKYRKKWVKAVFRMIAYSGDKIEIKNGDVFINDKYIPLPGLAKVNYEIKSKTPISDETNNVTLMNIINDTLIYIASLTAKEVEDYKSGKSGILSIKRSIGNKSIQDNFGPYKIPAVGDTINVDTNNYFFYQNIPGIQSGINVVKEKLYFVLGDNRDAAQDSRYIGFIAHSKMYGVIQ